jgi:hypothetical protein
MFRFNEYEVQHKVPLIKPFFAGMRAEARND